MTRLKQLLNELEVFLPGFEARAEQEEMMEQTYRAMREGLKAGFHAPTGTGKSFGYILPYYAVKLDQPDFKAAIGTFTHGLQEQLVKDIETIDFIYRKIKAKEGGSGEGVKYAVMKGKSNYFCRERYDKAKEKEELTVKFEEIVDGGLKGWIQNGTSLDMQNMGVALYHEDWDNSKVESCLERDCPFARKCTYFKHYFDETIDLFIVNHSLFMARFLYVDKAWEKIGFYVFDEAHKLEKVMLESRTFEISQEKLEKWALQGHSLLTTHGVEKEKASKWLRECYFADKNMAAMKAFTEKLDNALDNETTSIEKTGMDQEKMKKVFDILLKWQKRMADACVALVQEKLEETELKLEREAKEKEFKDGLQSWWSAMGELGEFVSLSNHEDGIGLIWFEKAKDGRLLFKVTPRDIQHVPNPFTKGLLFTSGTLAQKGAVSPFAKRLSVDLDIDKVMPTPFPLKEQTKVYVSKDCNPKEKGFEEKLEREIFDLIKAGEGKVFVLFTSDFLLRSMHSKLKDRIELLTYAFKQPMQVWKQEKGNFKDVIASFKNKNTRSVLFGTLTYFEGVDLRGEDLTQIILTRLPYSVPDHPIQEILDARHDYSAWEASIRFEQAFGRLIRTGSDYGTFAVLDNRIMKPFFAPFLEMLKFEGIPITREIADIKAFYEERKN